MTVTQKKRAILSLLFLSGTALLAITMITTAVTLWVIGDSTIEMDSSVVDAEGTDIPSQLITHSKPLANQVSQPTSIDSAPAILDNRLEVAPSPTPSKESQEIESLELAGPLLQPAAPTEVDANPGIYELPQLVNEPTFDSTQTETVPNTKRIESPGHNPIDEDLFLRSTSLEKINDELMPEVRAGFSLGRSGALYAARDQFISVLRQVAVAKDSETRSDKHIKLLAKGLRALDEAEDFLPKGNLLELDIKTNQIAVSHRTPLLNDDITPIDLSAQEAAALYARHAAVLLGEAVAGEPAGSMALYGLGKTFARLETQSKDPTAGQKCNVMYRAAVTSHPENYLAANELGVRLAKSGHYESAQSVLRHAAKQPSNATVYENLAAVEQALGNQAEATKLANTARQVAQREYANNEVSRRHGVTWVDPKAFQSGNPTNNPLAAETVSQSPPQTQASATQPTPQPQEPRSTWRQAIDMAKRATNWDRTKPQQATTTPSYVANPGPADSIYYR